MSISRHTAHINRQLPLKIARDVITRYLKNHSLTVYLVVFDNESYHISEELFAEVRSYIDANYLRKVARSDYQDPRSVSRRNSDMRCAFIPSYSNSVSADCVDTALKSAKYSLADAIDDIEDSFAEVLFRHIDNKEFTDPEVYKRANLDRKLFSKIRKNKDYQPSKTTALAFAIALELNLEETKDFIAKADYALTHSSKLDIIVEYFINRKKYDIFKLNEVLFQFDQPLLGSKVA